MIGKWLSYLISQLHVHRVKESVVSASTKSALNFLMEIDNSFSIQQLCSKKENCSNPCSGSYH